MKMTMKRPHRLQARKATVVSVKIRVIRVISGQVLVLTFNFGNL
jgi:hypothetical protein